MCTKLNQKMTCCQSLEVESWFDTMARIKFEMLISDLYSSSKHLKTVRLLSVLYIFNYITWVISQQFFGF